MFSRISQYMQAHISRCLWRLMPIVLIVCTWPLVLCNGKKHANTVSRPFCLVLTRRCVGSFVQTETHLILMASFLYISPLLSPSHRYLSLSIFRSNLAHPNFVNPSVSNLTLYSVRVVTRSLTHTHRVVTHSLTHSLIQPAYPWP